MEFGIDLTNMPAKSASNDFVTVLWDDSLIAIPFALHATFDATNSGADWLQFYYTQFDATLYKVITDDSNLEYVDVFSTDQESSYYGIRYLELSRQNTQTTIY
jgi:hypothetical protein